MAKDVRSRQKTAPAKKHNAIKTKSADAELIVEEKIPAKSAVKKSSVTKQAAAKREATTASDENSSSLSKSRKNKKQPALPMSEQPASPPIAKNGKISSAVPRNAIVHGDCVAGLNALPAGSVDLVFADPPFNIGYKYDVYDDKKKSAHYLDWSRQWIAAVHRALKPDGTFWLAIGDEYAAELKLLSQELGFHCRSWVIWYYTFGVNCIRKFTRSHAHIFHFVKDSEKFTFMVEKLENRIPSARQLVYNDARGNPNGRLPDDTWILRPQDLSQSFTAEEDTWYFPRVAGTHKQREGFHGCQMPEQLLGRIVRVCSREGELVVDPFSGSGTTLAVAKKLGRDYLGFDLSPEYAAQGQKRMRAIRVGEKLDGAPEPLMSAPATWQGKMRVKPPTNSKMLDAALIVSL